jgi:Fe2+ or Zn2+ uptake regulation protein
MSLTREKLADTFKREGFRLTRQREVIFDFLHQVNGLHPSARQVYEGVSRDHSDISVATVYNTLGAMVRLGIVKLIEFESGDNRYETNLEPHINLICSFCSSIQDLHIGPSIHARCAMERLGFHVKDFRLEYYGQCSECSGRKSEYL